MTYALVTIVVTVAAGALVVGYFRLIDWLESRGWGTP